MNRRTVLKSLVAGSAATAVPAQTPPKEPPPQTNESPKVEASVPDVDADPVARFFQPDQFSALARLCDLLEPSGPHIPGAKEARTAEFLDFLVSQSPSDRQSLYRTGLDRLNSESHRHFQQSFAALSPQQSATILEPLRRSWTYENPTDPLEHFLREAKSDIMQATRNSYEFISVASKRSRAANGLGDFWYPLY